MENIDSRDSTDDVESLGVCRVNLLAVVGIMPLSIGNLQQLAMCDEGEMMNDKK